VKKFLVVRHGSYNGDSGELDMYGRRQIGELAEKLKPHMTGTVKVISSWERRAVQSAQILAPILGVSADQVEMFALLERGDLDDVYDLVLSIQASVETLVIVGHQWLWMFPKFYGDRALGLVLSASDLKTGEACILDCEEKTLAHVA